LGGRYRRRLVRAKKCVQSAFVQGNVEAFVEREGAAEIAGITDDPGHSILVSVPLLHDLDLFFVNVNVDDISVP
jgi:hypothetical protein